MTIKERLKRMKLFFNIENELQLESLQLEEIKQKTIKNKNELQETEEKISNKKIELQEIEEKVSNKKNELQTLKTELVELKDFIDSKFVEEFKEYDYKVNITCCYIISINNKKYISLRDLKTKRTDWYTIATGFYNTKTYSYYDALSLDENGNYKYLYTYRHGYFDNKGYIAEKFINNKPDYEVHILELYPELSIFVDNYVPNTYLKKIYYEVNNLGGRSLIKKPDTKKK